MEAWHKVVTPRREVREGRSFSPDEFAIALEQVVAGNAPDDYRDPAQFFSRTYFSKALTEHIGIVLRRLSGHTDGASPVLTLVTQFGGGKTHTLTSLYHLAKAGPSAASFRGVSDVLAAAGLDAVPGAAPAVFVGNAWDPAPGRENPWIDIAMQIAGAAGVEALGPAAKTTPPGTETLARVFAAAGRPVLLLFDEVLNFINRHAALRDHFHAFLQNLTVATTGAHRVSAVISLPRSQVEMTPADLEWQDRITKVVKRVAKDLIVNDDAEIGEVVRRRLFQELGDEAIRTKVAKAFADWSFEKRHELPPEWVRVDSATSDKNARDALRGRFLSCYPFHPATLSVFRRKWQALPQFQQTRGTLAMLGQWIGWAYRDGFTRARTEPLITLGSAPLEVREFRAAVLSQLGEGRLDTAIEADIAGDNAHARVLDADAKGQLRDLHRRTGTAILFESSGGQTDKSAHLPELRFALCEPGIDTTSIDNAAAALESKCYFVRRVGTDGYRLHYQATLRKAVSDRRASLDEEREVLPEQRRLVEREFNKGASTPLLFFAGDSATVQDSPRLLLVVADPSLEWTGNGALVERLALWTRERGNSPRLYPASLIWCLRKGGRTLREKVENALAWKRVASEVQAGALGADYDKADLTEVRTKVADAEEAAAQEVWASYRFVALADSSAPAGLKIIDLGAGHASASESLTGRVLAALRGQALLNENVGAGYIDRHWPQAFKDSGAWPLGSLRQAFLNGSLTRLQDPDAVLKRAVPEFVLRGDFGLASRSGKSDSYDRVWFREPITAAEVDFVADVFLLARAKAEQLKVRGVEPPPVVPTSSGPAGDGTPVSPVTTPTTRDAVDGKVVLQVAGSIPAEVWNKFGTKVLPRLRAAGDGISIAVDLSVSLSGPPARELQAETRQALDDLGLQQVRVDRHDKGHG